jgi:methylase of polypeptide subunit release factors
VRLLDSPGSAARLRAGLDRAGLTFGAAAERLGDRASAHLAAGELAPLVRATGGGDALDTLLRLFVLGLPVPAAAAAAALAPATVDELAAGGLLRVAGESGDVGASLTLRPLDAPEGWIVAHDWSSPARDRPLARDHVIGVSASTLALAGATVRRHVGAALDLGTGCGAQALFATRHADRVVATDLNPRAVAMARLTMALNGLDVDIREGDMLAPVAGEAFGLVVANPPFVISPSQSYLFRDAGYPLDGLCRALVRAVPAHLSAGGHFQCLASWAHVAGEDWRERLGSWFAGTGCDALVLSREVLDPGAHATSWLRQTEPPERWEPAYAQWMDYYAHHRVEAIGLGLITMRRREDGAGDGWVRIERAEQDFAMPCGDHIGAGFELADFLAAHDGDSLLGAHLRVAPDVVLDERAAPAEAAWAVTDRRLRQTAGLCREGEVDGAIAVIVAGCDGNRTLADVLGDAARAAGAPPDALAPAALPVIRRLVEQGFLLPAAG